jgi:hypothetical protein
MTTSPLTPAAGDLRDFPHTPVYRARLFASEFHAQTTDAEWRAGVTLWMKSWDQVPAGSLPTDEVALCRLAELGRDIKTWRKLKAGALRGWHLCDDGRMYHPTVAEGVNKALESKLSQRSKTAKARIAALQKLLEAATTQDKKDSLSAEIEKVKQSLKLIQSQTAKDAVTDPSKPPVSQSVTDPVAESKEKGKLKEKEKEKGLDITEAKASGDKSPPDPELSASDLWKSAVELLTGQGMTDASARTFIGGLRKKFTNDVADSVIQAAVVERPAEARAWLTKACELRASQTPNTRKPAGIHTGFAGMNYEEGVDANGNPQ